MQILFLAHITMTLEQLNGTWSVTKSSGEQLHKQFTCWEFLLVQYIWEDLPIEWEGKKCFAGLQLFN